MGLCTSQPEQRTQSKHIDNSLRIARQKSMATFRLLLLGVGNSGKTTLFKQITSLYMGGFSSEKRLSLVPNIHAEVIVGIQQLLIASDLSLLDQADAQAVLNIPPSNLGAAFTQELASRIERLWHSDEVQRVFLKSLHLGQNDSLAHFCARLDRITGSEYVPSDDDVVSLHQPTLVVDNIEFCADGFNFSLVDVGGQKPDRKKWHHCFEGTQGVFFVVSLADYDVMINEPWSHNSFHGRNSLQFETTHRNRLLDALGCFREICHTPQLKHSAIILLLSKADVFRTKLETQGITAAFPGYLGPNEFGKSYEYIRNEFVAAAGSKPISVFCIQATKRASVQEAVEQALDITMQTNLKNSGFI